jgi:hypothetical protein
LTFYTSQAAFETDAPDLNQEDFASTLVGGASVCTGTPPLSSATSDGCFAAGNLISGFNADVTANGGSDLYVLLTTGFLGAPFNAIGPNSFSDHLDLNFTTPTNAVAFDLLGDIATAVSVQVEIFSGATSLGTTNLVGTATGLFWGVISDQNITRISMIDAADGGELIGNLQFGEIQSACDISAISVNADGEVLVSGACPDGVCANVWVSTACNLTVVDGGNATFLGCIQPGVLTDLGFYEDSCYYAADDNGNVLAVSAQTVPTLGEWAMIAFVVLLMFAGMFYMRRRRLA